jgi:hypothetical protein
MLGLLAAPWDEQRAYLERLFGKRLTVDELGLEFDDIVPVALAQGRHGGLSDEALRAVRDLNEQLTAMSDRPDPRLWTVDGLRESPDWARVRTLAQSALSLLPSEAGHVANRR